MFSTQEGLLPIAVDGSAGNVFAFDARGEGAKAIYEFNEAGTECISRIQQGFAVSLPPALIAIDNGAQSPNGGLNPEGRYLYVPSGKTQAESHLWAFEPFKESAPPVIEALSSTGITATGAEVKAAINPERANTTYTLKYEVEGSGEAHLAKEGTIPAGNLGVEVQTPLGGLEPATSYRVWAYAENECETVPQPECHDEAEISFTTYPLPDPLPPCPKDELREVLGLSAALPDCRAYELVTPPDTGGKVPSEVQGGNPSDFFGSPTAASDGARLAFMTLNGSLPGAEGGGGLNGSPYVASRDPESAWESESIGLSGAQSSVSVPGGLSPDLTYGADRAFESGTGSLLVEGKTSSYVRQPDGSFHLIGEGLEESDPNARARYISSAGTHTIFISEAHLLESSPAKGTKAIYDRGPEGPPVLLSTLPGGGTPTTTALYLGTSAQGNALAFKLEPFASSPLYLHIGGETLEASAAPGTTFAGLSADGRYLFYVKDGDLMRFDAFAPEGEQLTAFSTGAFATPVNVSADGGTAYFVSPEVLPSPGEPAENPEGEAPLPPAKFTGVFGAKGSGTLANGSTEVTAVTSSEGVFEAGMQISGPGIPAATTIAAVGAGTLTLSRAATQTGATSLTAVGSKKVTAVSVTQGALAVGLHVAGPGITAGTTIAAIDSGAQTVTLSSSTSVSGPQETTAYRDQNLYRSAEGQIEFVATVTERDVEGEFTGGGGFQTDGLGLWTEALEANNGLARDPSRTTADGNTLLFESRAELTGYDSEGKAEIYRFDSGAATLACLSCNPTGAAAEADASLVSLQPFFAAPEPLSRFALVANLSANGNRAFFQTSDRLVIGDTNHSQDVYEWEEGGTGSCATEGGCVYLISSGQSSTDDYLYGVSETGNDVFIWTTQRLLNRDADETPSIYDARVEGGFAEPEPEDCGEGDSCKPGPTPAPAQKPPESGLREATGNPTCPKGKHRVVREGGSVCVANKKKHHNKHHKHHKKHKKHNKKHHRQAKKTRRAAR